MTPDEGLKAARAALETYDNAKPALLGSAADDADKLQIEQVRSDLFAARQTAQIKIFNASQQAIDDFGKAAAAALEEIRKSQAGINEIKATLSALTQVVKAVVQAASLL